MHRPPETRAATVDDAHGIATVHVASWRAAYRGLMPQDVLDGLSVEQREDRWRRVIGDPDAEERVIVAAREGEVAGWASFGPGRDEGAAAKGELRGLYTHPDAFSTGAGHALIEEVERRLRADGFTSVYLWVLDGNTRAAAFYERHGWVEDGVTKHVERPGMTLFERRRAKHLA